jgi:hypothetical protein
MKSSIGKTTALEYNLFNLTNKNQELRRVFKNVVRGFSLVLHDPEGSHYKIWREEFPG